MASLLLTLDDDALGAVLMFLPHGCVENKRSSGERDDGDTDDSDLRHGDDGTAEGGSSADKSFDGWRAGDRLWSHVFFERVKGLLDNTERWNEFLKCLDLYSQEVLDRADLIALVSDILRSVKGGDRGWTLRSLLDEFERVIEQHMGHSENGDGSEGKSRDGEDEGKSRGGGDEGGDEGESHGVAGEVSLQTLPAIAPDCGGGSKHDGGKGRFACVSVRARDVAYAALPAGWLEWVAQLSRRQRQWVAGLCRAPSIAPGFEEITASACRDGPYETLIEVGKTRKSIGRLMSYFDGLLAQEQDERESDDWMDWDQDAAWRGNNTNTNTFAWYHGQSEDDDVYFRQKLFELPVVFAALGLLGDARVEELLKAELGRVRFSAVFDYVTEEGAPPNTLLIDPLFSFATWAKDVLVVPDDRYVLISVVKQNARMVFCGSPEAQCDPDVAIEAVKSKRGLRCQYEEDLQGHILGQLGKSLDGMDFSEEILRDRRVVLAAVKTTGKSLRYASDTLKGDRVVVLAAIKQAGWSILQFASPTLRDDRDMMHAAVRSNGLFLEYASNALKNDRGIVSIAVESSPLFVRKFNGEGEYGAPDTVSALRWASDELRGDRDIVVAAVRRVGTALQYVYVAVPGSMEKYGVKGRRGGKGSGKVSKEEKREARKEKRAEQARLKEEREGASLINDRAVVMIAIQADGCALQFASEELRGDREVVREAVRRTGWALDGASEELQADRDIVLEGKTSRFCCAMDILEPSCNTRTHPPLPHPHPLPLTPSLLRLSAMKQDGSVLCMVSEEFNDDLGIAFEAVKQMLSNYDDHPDNGDHPCGRCEETRDMMNSHGRSHDHDDSPEWRWEMDTDMLYQSALWADRSLMLELVEYGSIVMLSASTELRKDHSFVLEAIKRNGLTLEYASSKARKNRNVVLAAVRQNGLALKFASTLQGDQGVVLEAVQQNIEALNWVTGLWNDRTFALAVTKLLAAAHGL